MGRPRRPIDPAAVRALAQRGHSIRGIAARLGIPQATLYTRTWTDKPLGDAVRARRRTPPDDDLLAIILGTIQACP